MILGPLGGEVAVVVLLGGVLATVAPAPGVVWFIPVLRVIRPAAVLLGLVGSRTSRLQRGRMAWFGIRGVGSLYYLMYAAQHGLDPERARQLASLTLPVVAVSIVVHGVAERFQGPGLPTAASASRRSRSNSS